MLRQNDSCAQLPVEPAECGKKIGSCNGVKLACRLVENQNLWLQNHHGCKIQKLLLPAGQFRNRAVKPRLDPKEACHFCHFAANCWCVIAERLQSKGKFVPDLVGYDLVFRTLLDKPDFLCLFALRYLVQGSALKQNLAAPAPVRGKHRLQLPQKRRFSAAGRAAEYQKFPGMDRQREIGNGLLFLLRVCKIQVVEREEFHCLSSFRSRMTGVSTSAR